MARIIEGAPLAAGVKAQVAAQVQALKDRGVCPCLAVVVAGENPASAAYVRGKEKDCAECGVESRILRLPETVSQPELLRLLAGLAADPAVHGILVQLPLPRQIDEQAVVGVISPAKDVDGFTAENMGRLMIGADCFLPCTPAGVLEMIRSTGVPIAGSRAVVLGRSNIVGKPAALLLARENATVTLCHSHTRELADICRQADILVAAVGRAGFVTGEMVKPGAVVIDVGINRGPDGRLHGDVDFAGAAPKAGYLSPVPGGVGLMTRAMLLVNTVKAARIQAGL